MANEIFKHGKIFAQIREEANAKFDEIDETVGGIDDKILTAVSDAVPVFGVYTGDGETERTINLGFTPVAVELYRNNGAQYYYDNKQYGGFALDGYSSPAFEIVENGFMVKYSNSSTPDYHTNDENYKYYFIAYKTGTIKEYE